MVKRAISLGMNVKQIEKDCRYKCYIIGNDNNTRGESFR